jgi:glutathione S-transferase
LIGNEIRVVLDADSSELRDYLSESSAILFYLAQGRPLWPAETLLKTRVLQWMSFEQTQVGGVISRARFRRRLPEVIPTSHDEFVPLWQDGRRALTVLEHHLAGRTYLVGDAFGIADICLYAYVHCADQGVFDMKPYRAIRAWCARMLAAKSTSASTRCRRLPGVMCSEPLRSHQEDADQALIRRPVREAQELPVPVHVDPGGLLRR